MTKRLIVDVAIQMVVDVDGSAQPANVETALERWMLGDIRAQLMQYREFSMSEFGLKDGSVENASMQIHIRSA